MKLLFLRIRSIILFLDLNNLLLSKNVFMTKTSISKKKLENESGNMYSAFIIIL